jgi:hypothetical protein
MPARTWPAARVPPRRATGTETGHYFTDTHLDTGNHVGRVGLAEFDDRLPQPPRPTAPAMLSTTRARRGFVVWLEPLGPGRKSDIMPWWGRPR